MALGIILLLVIGALYLLFVKGFLWKILLGGFGVLGMWIFLKVYIPSSNEILITAGETTFSWAATIPVAVLLLALSCTKME
jgi:hypothetical protein